MSDRATCWSVTINNPLPADDENIASAKQRSGWKVEGQLEKGENGTPHYQLMVKTPQVRFTAIKKAFPRAHIEIARNAKALQSYVHKDDTKIGTIPETDKYPTMGQFWMLVYEFHEDYYKHDIDYPGISTEDDRLTVLDRSVDHLICQCYHVESLGVNPQIRSSAKKYLKSIFIRCEKLRRQKTDRQTELISEEGSIQDGDEESTCETESTCQTEGSETASSWSE